MMRAVRVFAILILLVGCEGLDVAVDAAPPDAAADARSGPVSISRVEWFHDSPCHVGDMDGVTIGITVGGADPGAVTYTGSAEQCIGTIMSNPGRLKCLERGAHNATVTVTDAAGHVATKAFVIVQCQPGST